MKKVLLGIIIIIILVAIILIGGLLYFKSSPNNFPCWPSFCVPGRPAPDNSTVDWIEAESPYFSFKYPPFGAGFGIGARIGEKYDPNMISFYSLNPRFEIQATIYRGPGNSYEDFVKRFESIEGVQKKNIIIDGINGQEFIQTNEQVNEADVFFPYPKTDATGWIVYTVDKPHTFDLSFFETFVSTFKFTK